MDGISAMLARKIIHSIEPRLLPRMLLSQAQYDAFAIGAAMLPLEQSYFQTHCSTEPLFGRAIAINGAKAHSATHAP